MTQFAMTDEPVLDAGFGVRFGSGTDRPPGVAGLGAAHPADAEGLLARLQSVVSDLGRAPADRDPVLWAAHEFTRCAQMLLGARACGADAAADLQPVLDHARSAMVSLTMARRASGDDDTFDTSRRPVNGTTYRG